MKILEKNLLFVLTFCLITQVLQGQQVYPAVVTGTLIRPYSLDLTDYAVERSSDIMFSVTLNDPVEPFRLVKYRLSVIHNGVEILYTNPNFNPPPIQLSQFSTEILDGNDLALYFEGSNLINASGTQGNSLLPEGLNEICLEVIDIQRNAPISNKAHLRGLFVLNQPPLLNLPIQGATIQPQQTQNLIFNWTPLHIGSGNAPPLVQYEFTMVELTPGIANPNDGFDFALPVYQTTTYTPSLLYTEGEPGLEIGKTYAWRVRAFDPMGSNLFFNNGKSEVFTFTVPFPPAPTLIPNYASSCNGNECEYQNISQNSTPVESLVPGQLLRIGYFYLKITQANKIGLGRYSGEGTVYVPFLGAKIKVAFSNIKVNASLDITEGKLKAKLDDSNVIPTAYKDNMDPLVVGGAPALTDAEAQNLANYFVTGSGQNKLSSVMSQNTESSATPIGLPMGFDKTIDSEKRIIAITSMEFTPTKARMNALHCIRKGYYNQWLNFGGRGLCLRPKGVVGDVGTLVYLKEWPFIDPSGQVSMKYKGQDKSSDPCQMQFDCQGFKEYQISGSIFLENNISKGQNNPNRPVTIFFHGNSLYVDDFVAKIDSFDTFTLYDGANHQIKDLEYIVEEGYLDVSNKQNPTGMTFPGGYQVPANPNDWRGYYLTSYKVRMINELDFTHGATPTEFTASNFMLKLSGTPWGNIIGNQIFTADEGRLNDWGFGIDSLNIRYEEGVLKNFALGGKIRTPAFETPAPFTGKLTYQMMTYGYGNLAFDIDLTLVPNETITSAFHSEMTILAGSKVMRAPKAGYVNGQWINVGKPYAFINSSNSFSVDEATYTQFGNPLTVPSLATVNSHLNISNTHFNISGLQLNGLKIDHPSLPLGQRFGMDGYQVNGPADISGVPVNVSKVRLVNKSILINGISKDGLGLVLDLNKDLIMTTEFWGTKQDDNQYAFSQSNMKAGILEFVCQGSCTPVNPASYNNTSINLKAGDEVLVGDFEMKLESISNPSGFGVTGTGTVLIPFLGINVKVHFNGITIRTSSEGFKVTSGNVMADYDPTYLTSAIVNVEGSSIPSLPLTSGLSDFLSQAPAAYTMPIPTKNKLAQASIGLIDEMAVVGLNLTPSGAKINLAISVPLAGGSQALFGARGICIRPNGFNLSELKLLLSEDMQYTDGIQNYIFKAYNTGTNTGSYAKFNCEGQIGYELEGQGFAELSPELFVSLNNTGSVKAYFSGFTNNLNDLILDTQVDSFGLVGWNGFVFKPTKAYLDLSEIRNPPGIALPDAYIQDRILEFQNNPMNPPTGFADAPAYANYFKGLFLADLDVTLSSFFDFDASGGTITLPQHNFAIPNLGHLLGNIIADNLALPSHDSLGGWPFGLDNLSFSIKDKSIWNSELLGNIQPPVVDLPVPYIGKLERFSPGIGLDSLFRMVMIPKPTTVHMGLWDGDFTFNDSSRIIALESINLNGLHFTKPSANLFGKLAMDVKETDFNLFGGPEIQEALKALEGALGIKISFNAPEINLQGFKIDDPSLPAGVRYRLDNSFMKGGIKIGSFEISFNQLQLLVDDVNLGTPSLPALGLSFDLGIPFFNFKSDFWGKRSSAKSGFAMNKIKMKITLPTFSCAPTDTTLTIAGGTQPLEVDQYYNIGEYMMQVTEVNGNSGKGKIRVPFIGTLLEVNFQNLVVNSNKQMVSGTVVTQNDANIFGNALTQISQSGLLNLAGIDLTETVMDALGDHINEATSLFTLPISLNSTLKKVADIEMPDNVDFLIVGMIFTPQGAKINAMVILKTGPGRYLKFGASGLAIRPNGINLGDIKLYLAGNVDLNDYGLPLPLTIKGGTAIERGGSYITFNCNGVKDFMLSGEYAFSPNQLTPRKPGESRVKANFSIHSPTATWGDFIGSCSIDSFSINGINDFVFRIQDAILDISKTSNSPDVVFPEGYKDTSATWRGFFLRNMMVTLPSELSFTKNDTKTTFGGRDLLIDSLGVTGILYGENVIGISAGGMDDWSFSIDTIAVKIDTSKFTNAKIDGGFQIPIMDKPGHYQGKIIKNNGDYRLDIKPVDSLSFAAWRVKLQLDTSSTITAELQTNPTTGKKKFKPYAVFDGKVGVDVSKKDFLDFGGSAVQDAISTIESVLGSEITFQAPELHFKGLKINHPSLPAGKRYGLDTFNIVGGITVAGQTLNLDQLTLLNQPISLPSNPGQMFDGLGFEFELQIPLIKFKVGFWAKSPTGQNKFSFGKFDFKVETVQFRCACDTARGDKFCVTPIPTNHNPIGAMTTGDMIKVGDFNMTLTTEPTGTGNGLSGEGKITIPFLANKVGVTFNNIKVNDEKQMFEGQIFTKINSSLLQDGLLKTEDGGSEIAQNALDMLNSHLTAVNEFFTLPISMREKLEKAGVDIPDDVPDFILSGLVFKPDGAAMDAVMILNLPSGRDIQFGIRGMRLRPNGASLEPLNIFLKKDFRY